MMQVTPPGVVVVDFEREGYMRRSRLVLVCLLIVAFVMSGVTSALAAVDDIPGEFPQIYEWMPVSLNGASDYENDAVYQLYLARGDEVSAWTRNGLFGFDLFAPGATSVDVNTPLVARGTDEDGYPMISYRAPYSGVYYVDAWAPSDAGNISDEVLIHWWPFTQLTLNGASTQSAGYAATAGISSTLRDGDGDPFDISPPVEVYRSVNGGAWSLIKTLPGTENPVKTYTETPKVRTSYKMVVKEDDWTQGSTSPIKTVIPKVKLTRSTSWTSLAVNRTYYAKGYIYPAHKSSDTNKVKIRAYKMRSDGSWRYVKSFTAGYSYVSSTRSQLKAAVKLTSKGKWKLVAYHAADSRNGKTYGSPDYVTVK